jgi:signal transduction histidine kinase/ActR/RegA family two-component response regulator
MARTAGTSNVTDGRALLVGLALSLAGVGSAAAQAAATPADTTRRVLVLMSYEQGTVWSDAVIDGFRSVVDDSDLPLDLWIEYLDVNRRSDPAHMAQHLAAMHTRFGDVPFDLVVASDDAAVSLVAEHAETIFAGLPVVACGVNERSILDRFGAGRVTAYIELYDAAFMPRLAQQLRPGTRRFVVITDNTRTGATVHDLYKQYAATRADLTFEFLDGRTLPLERIVAAARQTGNGDAILISNFLRDRDQRHYPAYAAVRRIAEAAGAPLFTPVLSTLGQGITVGLDNRGAQHGAWAGRQALRLLSDPRAALSRTVDESPGRVVADVRMLDRWRLARAQLPAGTIFVNETPSFYREHRGVVLGVAVFATVQFIAIGILATNVRRRRRAEDALRARTEHLERTLAELEEARSERLAIEERMRQGERLESMGRLAGGIAHDFNNLLTVIMSYAEIAAQSSTPGSEQAEQLDQILLASRSAADLTRQILAFSRKQVLQPAIVDINRLVRESLGMLSRLLGEHVTMSLQLGDDLPPIRIDRTQLQQVLVNLAVNARDAMPGGGALSVHTSVVAVDDTDIASHPTMTAGRYVLLAVRDTGVGMSREVLDRIFDPFFTTKAKGRGTGLGLASVYGTVKQSGGWIWASSEVGFGTTFKIHFPALPAAAASPDQPSAASADSMRLPGSVLMVEDEDEILRLAVRTLEDAGVDSVVTASSVRAARERLERLASLDLLVTDVVLPDGTGRAIAQLVAARFPAAKILFISGYTDTAGIDQGMLDEGTAFLPKPFTPRALLDRVTTLMTESAV